MRTFLGAKLVAVLLGIAFLSVPAAAQEAGAAQETVAPEKSLCTACHNDTTLIVSKQAQFHRSAHGSGDSYERGSNKSCAGCHGSEAAKSRIEAGLMPHAPSIEGVLNVSPYTCRTCHAIHTDFTLKDFSVIGDEAPVELEKTGTKFDGGAGNLCASCHQIRNDLPAATNGEIVIESSRFGPHHGVEAQMLLGEGGLGIRSRAGVHYKEVADTCVDCHMGPVAKENENDPLPYLARNHTFEPQAAYCTSCHKDLKDLDYKSVQTDVQALLDEVKGLLLTNGIMDNAEGMENRAVPGTYPEAVANAMWNYMVVLEDGSKGVHHPDWAKELLEYARDALTKS